jgi:hypothetical protein
MQTRNGLSTADTSLAPAPPALLPTSTVSAAASAFGSAEASVIPTREAGAHCHRWPHTQHHSEGLPRQVQTKKQQAQHISGTLDRRQVPAYDLQQAPPAEHMALQYNTTEDTPCPPQGPPRGVVNVHARLCCRPVCPGRAGPVPGNVYQPHGLCDQTHLSLHLPPEYHHQDTCRWHSPQCTSGWLLPT